MKHISTTDLRTKSSELIQSLKRGETISLIHHSKVVGVIQPAKPEHKVFNSEEFSKILDKIGTLPDLSYEERDKIYRDHLEKKCGKNLS